MAGFADAGFRKETVESWVRFFGGVVKEGEHPLKIRFSIFVICCFLVSFNGCCAIVVFVSITRPPPTYPTHPISIS